MLYKIYNKMYMYVLSYQIYIMYKGIASTAKRYAQAVFTVTKMYNMTIDTYNNLRTTEHVISSTPKIKNIMYSKSCRAVEIDRLFIELKSQCRMNNISTKLLLILKDNKKLYILPRVLFYLHRIVQNSQGIIPVYITVAKSIEKDMQDTISRYIAKFLNSKVDPLFFIDPSIISGIKVEFQSCILDLSLASKINNLEKLITEDNI